MTVRTGIGVDAHPLVEGRPLVLGGVEVPSDRGLSGHSDGDVLVHAVIDALLGAAGQGDIGTHFPSTDAGLKGIASTVLLARANEKLVEHRWRVTYVDATIVAERPALGPYVDRMRQTLADRLGLDADQVNVKATTTDGLGFVGRGEGISSLAVATVQREE
jgi:2-C-methyl-D-erythritol 2,4-cyclodiphosphate synthase